MQLGVARQVTNLSACPLISALLALTLREKLREKIYLRNAISLRNLNTVPPNLN